MFSHYLLTQIIIRTLFPIVIFFAFLSNLLASENQPDTGSALLTGILSLRLEGVSLNMSQTEIQTKLQAAGYTQVSPITFIKELPLPGGRQSIYRIEFEHTPSISKLGYFRSESGGRNKSPVTESRPMPQQARMSFTSWSVHKRLMRLNRYALVSLFRKRVFDLAKVTHLRCLLLSQRS